MALPLDRIRLMVPDNVITRAVEYHGRPRCRHGTILHSRRDRHSRMDTSDVPPSAQIAYDTLLAEYAADPLGMRADVEALVEALLRRTAECAPCPGLIGR